jgi:hypothetical protein
MFVILRSFLLLLFVLLGVSGYSSPAAREQVATVGDTSVYHWRVFDSKFDDVDRALVLREFNRRGFKLPKTFVEEAIDTMAHGDRPKLVRTLQRKGCTLDDLRQFVAEEIKCSALVTRYAKDSGITGGPPQSKQQLVAKLRNDAQISKSRSNTPRR